MKGVRTIKVGRRVYRAGQDSAEVVRVPFIRLSGLWLAEMGFVEGDTIEITTMSGEIRMARKPAPGDNSPMQQLLL